MERTGKAIVIFGVVIVIAGIVIWLAGDKLKWIGRLPGDIRVQRENFSFYMPVTTMIIISIVLSVILWLINRFR